MSSRRIQIELFKRLNRVGGLDRSAIFRDIESEYEERDDEEVVAITRATDDLVGFVRNFFIQFFYEGYNFEIDGFNEETSDELEGFFEDGPRPGPRPPEGLPKPELMLEQFQDYLDLDK